MKIKICSFLLVCLVSSWCAFADPCEVVNNHDEGDSSGYNSSSLRYIVDDFINGLTNARCDSLGSEDDADYDQTILFNSALNIELNKSAGGIVFDVETAAGQLIVGSSSGTLSTIDGTSLGAGESPFQCSSKTADGVVNLRNLLIITKDTNEAEFYANNLCMTGNESADVYVCQEADYDDSVSPGATGWCDGGGGDGDGTLYYPDDDGDGYGDDVTGSPTNPGGYVTDDTDCDDGDAGINPGEREICGNDIDENCDGVVQECRMTKITMFRDADEDLYGDATVTRECWVFNSLLADSHDWVITMQPLFCDGYVRDNTDCDDTTDARFPGNPEICDELDNDCNFLVDDGIDCSEDDTIYYPDDDGDTYGDPDGPTVTDTTLPAGYVEDHTDCNDANSEIHPGAIEVCDGIDNDCDGLIDEGFDVDGDGYTTCADDCNDANPAVHPGQTEVCDGVDNNCDGQIDENLDCTTPPDDADADADGDGYTEDDGDCDDANAAINPGATEICDGIDNDCDGSIDEDNVCAIDADQDGYPSIDTGGTDCNDNDASVHPDATEICGDGIDQDCSGSDVVCDVIVPDPSTDAVVCDVNIDSNADGLPDALDPVFGDIDGDGTPDCCTNGQSDVILLNYDSDGDGASNCREFALSTDPSLSDLGFQGGAENFGCSLSLTSQTTSGKSDSSVWFIFMSLAAVILFRIRKAPMNLFKPLMVGLGTIAILSFSSPSQALNVQTFAPADAVGSGYGLFTSQTLAPGQFVVGSFFDYAQHPLEIGLTNGNARVFGIVDQFVTADVITTVGLFDHVNLTANMPINIYHNIAPTLIPNRDTGYFDLGDLRLSSKIQLLDADTSAHNWGFALVPFVTVPTGDESIYLGDTGVTGGGSVVAEKKFGPHRLYVNAGAQLKQEETLGNLVVGNAVTYGAGYQHQFSETHAISAIAEVQGSTAMDDLFGQEITTPVGARLILQKDFLEARNLHTYVGGGMGLTSGYGASDYRVYSGISLALNAPHQKKIVETVKPAENFVGLVYFENDKDQFTQDNWAAIQNAANFWKSHQSSPVLVVGHADSNWTNDYNMKLSERRALTVLRALVKLGVPQENIKVSYYGEEQPVDTNDTDAGRRNNRAAKMQIIVGAF